MRLIRNIIIAFIGILLLVSLSKTIFSYKDKRDFFREYDDDYKAELEMNKKLKSELKSSSDSYIVEKNIREQLQLLKPNEVAVILPSIKVEPTPTPTPMKKPYEEWLDLVIKK